MTSQQFLDWLTATLDRLGLPKVVPPAATLADVYRYYHQRAWLNARLDAAQAQLPAEAGIVVPGDLETVVRDAIAGTTGSWESAVEHLATRAYAHATDAPPSPS
jgi:hypothetical protein